MEQKITHEVQFYLTSLGDMMRLFWTGYPSHWVLRMVQHWIDVTLMKMLNVRTGHAPQNLALRRIAPMAFLNQNNLLYSNAKIESSCNG